jgi:D-sedoheptulose 7-phosphate isomerase
MKTEIAQHLRESAAVKERMAQSVGDVERLAEEIIRALRGGRKVVIFGNGGSAADAQHFAAELVGRFEKERAALPAIALTTDTSLLTALGNDYTFDIIYARQVQALVRAGDVVIGISTSGNSPNVLKGLEEAKKLKAWTAGLTGMSGGKLKALVDCCIRTPSERTAHVQECHIAIIHAICAGVDEAFSTQGV